MKRHRRNNILILLISFLCIINMAFIFSNSLQAVESSQETSETVYEIVEPIIDAFVEEKSDGVYFIRKCAHVVEFFCLGVLLAILTQLLKKKLLYA